MNLFIFLDWGFFFSNLEKSHLNPNGKGAEFRPLRTPKKSLPYRTLGQTEAESLSDGEKNHGLGEGLREEEDP